MAGLDAQQEFLLAEYRQAQELTYHIDELRNRLTGFFLVFAGAAAAGLAMLLKGELPATGLGRGFLVALVSGVGLLGLITIVILARLRSAQLEHFRIINNIRARFLGNDVDLWNVVELSADTLPGPTCKSGTFFWMFQINLLVAAHLGYACYLLLDLLSVPPGLAALAATVFGVASLVGAPFGYLKLAEPRARRTYTVAPKGGQGPTR